MEGYTCAKLEIQHPQPSSEQLSAA